MVDGSQHSHKHAIMLLLLVSMMLIAACSANGDSAESLPTLAQLPTETERPREAIGLQATLPPTWTLTPSETATAIPSVTDTLTITPSLTITDTPTMTLTATPVPTQEPRPVTNLVELALQATILPQDYSIPQRDGINVTLPPSTAEAENIGNGGNGASIVVVTPAVQTAQIAINCTYYPAGGFAAAFSFDASIAQNLGCPVGNPPNTISLQAAFQVLERGFMVWLGGSPNYIYAFYNDGTYQRFIDNYDGNVDPASGGEVPPSGLREPMRGFGKVWRSNAQVKSNLGWGVSEEFSATATVQSFERGLMVYIPARGDILVLIANADLSSGTWKSVSGQF